MCNSHFAVSVDAIFDDISILLPDATKVQSAEVVKHVCHLRSQNSRAVSLLDRKIFVLVLLLHFIVLFILMLIYS